MADVGSRSRRVALVLWLGAVVALAWCAAAAYAQTAGNPPTPDDMVVDVRIVGNQSVSLHKVITFIRTRAGRKFDPTIIEEDVRRLSKSRLFVNVSTSYQRTPEGIIAIFQVVERPTLAYVKYVGTSMMRTTMDKQSGLKVGDAIDPYMVDESRRKIEEYYHSKGFTKARVALSEGNKPGDRGAVFLIHEGPKQRISEVKFDGNTIADDARLKTQITSKPPILYFFKGEVDEDKIDEDVEKLTEYYRGLGFFNAKIGRELAFAEDGRWATLRFVINEGPRYKVNNISIVGASKYATADLADAMTLKGGKYFDQDSMQRDITSLQDRYGGEGYIYCVVNPDRRLSETPGEMDLVYQIEEGAKYHVGRVNVHIEGDTPHTRVNTVLNRVDLRPHDIADIRKMRDSERRLKASGLFVSNPTQGNVPTITWETPEDNTLTAGQNEAPGGGNYRGQSPDDYAPTAPSYGALPNYEESPEAGHRLSVGYAPTFAGPNSSEAPNHASPPIAPLGHGNPFIAHRPRMSDETGELIAPPSMMTPLVETIPVPVMSPVPASYSSAPYPSMPTESMQVRFQSPGYGGAASGSAAPSYGQVPLYSTAPGVNAAPAAAYGAPTGVVLAQYVAPAPSYPPATAPAPIVTPAPAVGGGANFGTPAPAYTPPQFAQPAPSPSPYMGNAPGVGASPLGYNNGGDLFGQTVPPVYPGETPSRPVDINIGVQEAQTGRFMLGVGVNSNAGVVGSIIVDEQNADITRLPTSWRDFVEGRAFRGAGQQLRLEAVPGTQVSRYSFIFRQPYLFDTRIQLGLSAYYFQRYYQDWLEERLGGRVQLGYQFPHVPDLSISTAVRMEDVGISQPTQPTPPTLSAVLGHSSLFVSESQIVHDTRDNTFLATQGHRIALGFDQAFGDYNFSRATVEGRQHFMLYERPDRSGRHVVTMMSQLGFTGSDTPIFENYFAGGFSSMRGFNFRGVGPFVGSVNIGGRFQWLNTVEYMFPLSADDMVRGVVFCDFGTVEQSISMHSDNYRVAPGFGLRLTIPAMGPAPIALDLSVPIAHAPGDNIQNFAFYVGFGR